MLGNVIRHGYGVTALSIGLALQSADPTVAQDGVGNKAGALPTTPMPAEAFQPLVLPPLGPVERAEVQQESQETREPTNVELPEQAKDQAKVEPSAPEQVQVPEQAQAPSGETGPAQGEPSALEQVQVPEQAQVPSDDTGPVAAIPVIPETDGILARTAQWLSKDLTSYDSPADAARSIGLSLLSLAGGLLAISAGIRGVGKGFIELRMVMKGNRDCVEGIEISAPPINELVIFHDMEDDRILRAQLQSRAVKNLADFFPGKLYAKVVDKASRMCTLEKPFPQQHFSSFLPRSEGERGLLPKFMRDLLGAYPDEALTIEVFHSSLIRVVGASLGLPIKQGATRGGCQESMVIIPVVEKPRRRQSLELTTLPEDIFNKFSDPEFADELRRNIPPQFRKVLRRIDQVELAYKVECAWREKEAAKGIEPDPAAPVVFFPRFELLMQETDGAARRREKRERKQREQMNGGSEGPQISPRVSESAVSDSDLLH